MPSFILVQLDVIKIRSLVSLINFTSKIYARYTLLKMSKQCLRDTVSICAMKRLKRKVHGIHIAYSVFTLADQATLTTYLSAVTWRSSALLEHPLPLGRNVSSLDPRNLVSARKECRGWAVAVRRYMRHFGSGDGETWEEEESPCKGLWTDHKFCHSSSPSNNFTMLNLRMSS